MVGLMTAADRREELEAAIWRHWPVHPADVRKSHTPRVDAILAAADAYAQAKADEEARALRQSVAVHGYTGRQT